jgi:DNA mismatch repair protein MutL
MADVIQLLPENVANQIAAGEVVQRPASVVKELLENAVDAGATQIRLIVKDAGKALIQVTDNGCGMTETDARMCFERHATSKIRTTQDIFAIRTMGFRGEAMASIAAVAQVEMRTRRQIDELGTLVQIENSQVTLQEPCQHPTGTSVAVKNLFFNVPARRNFLKGDAIEMRHIMDEFQRVALANHDVFFSLHHNDQEIFHLPAGNLRQRIVKILGEAVNKKIVPAQEETEMLRIKGFVGKPDTAKKSRGEQFFFVNNRFIKSAYLHHAVVAAYEDLIPEGQHPMYVLFLELDPVHLDINIHPTKQEIKFDDEKLTYNVLKVSVRHALGSNNVTPTLDFDQEPAFIRSGLAGAPPPSSGPRTISEYTSKASGEGGGSSTPRRPDDAPRHEGNLRNWQRLYEGLDLTKKEETPQESETVVVNIEQWLSGFSTEKEETDPTNEATGATTIASKATVADFQTGTPTAQGEMEIMAIDDQQGNFTKAKKEPYQIHNQYIVSQIKSGFLLIDQQTASERVLYERYLQALTEQPISTQSALFPRTMDVAPADAVLLREILPEINRLGFDIGEFGGNTFVIHGHPAELPPGTDEVALVEKVLDQYRNNMALSLGITENIARSMARNAAIKKGQSLTATEMQDLVDQLFACAIPYKSPFGRNCFITIELEELLKRFS